MGEETKEDQKIVWRCHQLLSGFLAKGVASVTSVANYKGDNEMMLEHGGDLVINIKQKSVGLRT